MSVPIKVAVGMGGRALVGAVGSVVSGAYGIVSKTGQAIGAAGKALSSAARDTSKKSDTPSNNVIIANTGMAGTAGKQKVTGGGTLPAPKAVAKPQVSTKMPTEKLLDTAVKYLTSIDKTLKAQLEFERRSYQEQAQLDREAIIENKPSTTFNDIKDRLSGFKSDTKDNVSMAGTILKYAAILGGAAALIASSLDQKQLDALKENVEEFKKKFGWLGDLGSMVGAGGILGFLFGGKGLKGRLKGGLQGMIAAHIGDRLYSSFVDGYKKDENGNDVIDPKTGQPIKESRSMSALGVGLSGAAGIMAGRFAAKKIPQVIQAGKNIGQLGKAARASSVVGIQAATKKGTSWLASRRGRKFLVILGRKLGKGLMARIGKHLARIVAMALLGATGIGAIPAIVGILVSVAFIGWDLVDIATGIWDAWNESSTDDNAAAVPAGTKEQDAVKVGGTSAAGTAGSAAGKSLGKVTPEMLSKTPQQLTDDELRTLVEAQGRIEDPSGVTNNPGGIRYGTGPLKEHQVGSIGANADPSVRIAKYDTAENGIKAAMINWKTSRYAGKPIRDSLGMWSGGDGARYESWLTGKTAQYTGSGTPLTGSSDSSISGMVNSGVGKMGEMFGAVASSIIKPGVARDFSPSTPNISERINNESLKLQNDITFGIKNKKTKDTITAPTTPGINPSLPKPIKSISSFNPNYKSIDVLSRYVSHFRLAS